MMASPFRHSSSSVKAFVLPISRAGKILRKAAIAENKKGPKKLHMNQTMLVSVVIPTRNRPQLVCRALASVLSQTYRNFEAVVVVDGPDRATEIAIRNFQQPCIRIVALAESVGGSEARNTGVREAKGEWVAFLDDDDEWLPEKLERQINEIGRYQKDVNFSACRLYLLQGATTSVMPELFPEPGQDIGEYLYCEVTRLGRRRGGLQTSTWLVKRDLCLANPFTSGLRRHQDTDWLLKANANHQLFPCFVAEPCTIFHAEPDRERISTRAPDWRFSFDWANNEYLHLNPKVKAYLYATVCTGDARHASHPNRILYFLWKHCDRSMRFSPQLLLMFLRELVLGFIFRHKYVLASWLWLRTALRGGSTEGSRQVPVPSQRTTPKLDPAHEN